MRKAALESFTAILQIGLIRKRRAGRFVLLLLMVPLILNPACSRNQAFNPPEPLQMLPVVYYDCIQMTPYDVIWSYFDPYGYRWRAEEMYTGKVIVFKNVEVTQRLLDTRGEDFIWVDQIRCFAATPDEINKIKSFKMGQKLDVVGIMAGVDKDSEYLNTIKMADCYYSTAGMWAIPTGAGASFTPGY
jgi:hypothetical protein